MQFVHLHTHSHYSIGRAVPPVRQLVRRAAHLDMPALALTDNNSIAGMHELAEAARKYNIHPILGCELDLLPSDHGAYQGRTHRLVVLVENETGYRNLVALLTRAHAQPADLPPHVRFKDFEAHADGLIVLTGSPRSELYHWMREGSPGATKDYLNHLAAVAGAGNLFFEICDYPHPRTRRIMDNILELSRFLGIPAVATQNVHYIERPDILAYCALTQQAGLNGPRWPLPAGETPTRYFATPAEMQKRFAFTPEILEQSLAIARRCNFSFPRHRRQVPVPEFDRGQDASSLLWEKTIQGATRRYGVLSQAIKERINREYGDIRGIDGQGQDLCELLLLLEDVATFLRQQGLCRGVGRGEWACSVVAYTLGITEIDPIAYKLDYRPLRTNAAGFPVFDIEVSTLGMEETLRYLRDKYGAGNCLAVGRRQDWKRNDLFQHLCHWAGLPPLGLRQFPPDPAGPAPETEAEDSEEPGAAPLPPRLPPDVDIESEPESARAAAVADPFRDIPLEKSLRDHRTLADVAYTLHPCPRAFEPARGQYVLSREPLGSLVPVVTLPAGNRMTLGDAELLDHLLLPRLQFSPPMLLNILERAQRAIRQAENPAFTLAEIPLDDEPTFRILGLGLTNGIPPLHGISDKSLLRAERPASIPALVKVHARARKKRAGDQVPDPVEFIPDSILGYRCAWLKVHYPVAFMVAVLTHTIQSLRLASPPLHLLRPRFQILLREARKMNIEVVGPDINFSAFEFSQERRRIRTGLMAILGLGEQTFQEIASIRDGRPFSSLADFCQRTDPRSVNQTQIGHLIRAGAFDKLEPNRRLLLQDFERALKNARARASRAGDGPNGPQLFLFDNSMFEEDPEPDRSGDPVPFPTQFEIIRYERESLGYSVTYDLLEHNEEFIRAMRAVSPFDLHPRQEGRTVFVAGHIDLAEKEGSLVGPQAALILDLEGKVVKIPPEAVPGFNRVQHTADPVLIEGVVEKHTGTECFLVARSFHLMEEIRSLAREAAVLRLSLAGENWQTLRRVRALLRAYRGTTRVVLEEAPGLSWWVRWRLEKLSVFYCPPLYLQLLRLLPRNRIRLFDGEGRSLPVGDGGPAA